MCETLATGAAAVPLADWSALELAGRDSERFLQAMLSCDLEALAPGRAQPFTLLDRSGRLRAFGQVARQAEGFVLLLPRAAAASARAQLEAHLIADQVEISAPPTPPLVLELGPAARAAHERRDRRHSAAVAMYGHPGVLRWDDAPPEWPLLDVEQAEILRMLSGWPRWGVEARAGQLVNETTLLELAVHAGKGCYIGQETVNKLQSHRGAAFAPKLLELAAGAAAPATLVGATLRDGDGRRAAEILAAVRWQGSTYLHAQLRRELRVDGRELDLGAPNGARLALQVRPLPLLAAESEAQCAERLFRLAVEAFQADDDTRALELLELALALDPGHADAYESLGVIHRRHGRLQEAEAAMRSLLELDPDSVLAHSNLSIIYQQQGRIEAAEQELAAAAAARSRSQQRQQTVLSREQADRAAEEAEARRKEEMFRAVLELDAEDPLANFSLGQLLVERGRSEESLAHLEQALAGDPGHSAAHLAYARALEAEGRTEEARGAYARGLEVASAKGALMVANQIQERLSALGSA